MTINVTGKTAANTADLLSLGTYLQWPHWDVMRGSANRNVETETVLPSIGWRIGRAYPSQPTRGQELCRRLPQLVRGRSPAKNENDFSALVTERPSLTLSNAFRATDNNESDAVGCWNRVCAVLKWNGKIYCWKLRGHIVAWPRSFLMYAT